MNKITSILCAVVIAAGCFACAPAPFSPPPPPPPSVAYCPDKTPFLDHVGVLTSAFNPRSNQAPPPGSPISAPYDTYLTQAYGLAQSDFQRELCALTRIYVDALPAPCSGGTCFERSWGFRRRGGPGRYIAISAGLLDPTLTYSKYETALLQSVLPLNAYYSTSNVDSIPGFTVLAALAHELGHVRWYDILVATPGGPHNFNKLCSGDFFKSWQTLHPPYLRFRNLLTYDERHRPGRAPDLHVYPPQILTDIDPVRGNPPIAGQKVDKIYASNAPWTSFLGAITPDEDFVETYKFYVLSTATSPLKSLPIVLPGGYSEDVPADYWNVTSGKGFYRYKVQICIQPNV
jgi:hypothetical protein